MTHNPIADKQDAGSKATKSVTPVQSKRTYTKQVKFINQGYSKPIIREDIIYYETKGNTMDEPKNMMQSNSEKPKQDLPNWPCEWEGCLNEVKYQIDLGIDDVKPWICNEHMDKLYEIFDVRCEDDE